MRFCVIKKKQTEEEWVTANALYLGLLYLLQVLIAIHSTISCDFTAAENRLISACPKIKINFLFVIN